MILQRAHGDFRHGYPVIRWTLARLNLNCDWPGMKNDITEKVTRCPVCQAYQPKHIKEVLIAPVENTKFLMDIMSKNL